MPTENRFTDIVSVPRELLARATDNKHIDKERISIHRHEALFAIRGILAQPAQHHQDEPVAWSRVKPATPGAYWVRGNGLDQDALIQVIDDQGELRCNLHQCTTETDFGYGYAVSDLSEEFEWLGPLYTHPAPAACAHEWTDDGEWNQTCTKCYAHVNHEPYGWVQTRGPAINQFTREWDVVEGWEAQGVEYKAMHDHLAPADPAEIERLHKGHINALEALSHQSESQRDHWMAECEALRAQLRLMTGDYRTAIVNGHERVTFLGGDCDSVEKMLEDNPNYASAQAALNREP